MTKTNSKTWVTNIEITPFSFQEEGKTTQWQQIKNNNPANNDFH